MAEGERVTFTELVLARSPALLRLAVMLTGDPYEAEDLLQSTLLSAARHGERVAAMAAPAAYLRRIMLNEHLSRGRRRRRAESATLDRPPTAQSIGDAAETASERDETWRWLATLPAAQRTVLVLRYYEDLPDAEIAGLLGCAESTVRSHAFRGLRRLRDHLEQAAKEADR